MRFFRRGEPALPTDFWGWWAASRDGVANAIETGSFDPRLIEDVNRAVRGIDPRLAWEFAPGRQAKHALCVTPEGNAEVRPSALRWLAGAPSPDATWEYYASRQASPSRDVLEVGGLRLALSEMRAISSWDASRRRIDVRLWHDVFAQAPLPVRQQIAFLFLDNLLGEDDVERWVGVVDLLEAPAGGRTPLELKAEIERHAAEPAGETWVLAQGTTSEGRPVIVTADAGLKRIDQPFADQHVSIRIQMEGGEMPDNALAETLNAEEDRLVAALAGAATLAGRTTSPGERVIHFVAEDLDRVRGGIDGWAKDAPEWRVKVDFQHDPSWEFQRELGVR